MTANKKMIEAVSTALEDCAEWDYEMEYDPFCGVDSCDGYLANPDVAQKEVAQAVINAAWCEFDPEDKSTWPVDGQEVLLIWVDNINELPPQIVNAIFRIAYSSKSLKDVGIFRNGNGFEYRMITHYADPNDLLFVRSETNGD